MILVDSTVWIDLLRKQETGPVAQLRKLLDVGEAAITPVIMQEVLQGARNAPAFARLQRRFAALPFAVPGPSLGLHVAAARLYARARWRGITPRSPHDCLIAVTAIEARIPLLHDDGDFELLAKIDRGLKLVPRHQS